MGEFIGLAYYAEIPSVIFDVQRTGPSTGMPTRTQQGDLLSTAYASHGDTKHIVLFPSDPGECFHFAVKAFDIAERFQTPVFVLSDLDIGMNDWVIPKLEWDDAYRPDRGKVLTAEQLEKMEKFHRYLDVDGDGVPYRSLPGVHPKGAYFVRGSGHDKYGRYTEDEAAYADVMERIARKIDGSAVDLPEPVVVPAPTTARPARKGSRKASERGGKSEKTGPIGLIAIGGTDRAMRETQSILGDQGVAADYMRIRSFPFHPDVKAFLESHDRIFVVEQNRDGQLASLLTLETGFPLGRLEPVRLFGGMPLSASDVVDRISEALGQGKPKASALEGSAV
jgi:2-oxoglutarate ferredoxin oxidoreductase subunit alpha